MTPAPKLTAIKKAAEALAQLSDAEWLRVKDAEDRRRAEQRSIRDLSQHYRELRDRKITPEPARGSGTR
jgi:hypothetical protein